MKKIRFLGLVFVLLATVAQVACSKKGPTTGGVDTESSKYLKRFHFDFDRYTIRSDAVSTLKDNARWMKESSSKSFVVEGHCDERGTNEYNMALGERRAKAAKDYLVNLGVSASKLTIISFGEERPADSGHSESAWAQNRRGEFLIRK